ncbi:MAG: NAD(P)-binding protein, partial [Zoogloea sp.]|nr:NAD(P)-binding protein [Zoogloea sp.]
MSTQPKVAIVGGGYAGLACAVTLARAGARVSVFERSQVLGGRARVVEKDGWRVDNGQHILIGAYTETLRMLRLVGVRPGVLDARPLALVYPGEFELRAARLPAPLHLAAGLLRAKGLDWSDRLAMLRFMRTLKRQGYRLARDMPVAQLLAKTRQTERLVRYLWEPLCVAALNTPLSEASAQTFANVLRDSLGGGAHAAQVLLPKVDLSELFPVPATRWLGMRGHGVHTAETISAVTREEDGFRLEGGLPWERYEHVVVATAPYHANALIGGFDELAQLRETIAGLAYEPIVTVYLAFPQPVQLPEPMLGLAGGLAQWVFQRGGTEAGGSLLAVVISARGRHEALTREDLAQAVRQELEARLGRLPPVSWSEVITEKRATF